jgi:hypothetical protein
MRGRAALAWVVGLVLSLPAAASMAVVLTVPPLTAWVPAAVSATLRPLASLAFSAVGGLVPDSVLGQLFYGSFALLQGFGPSALAVHAALLGLPWVALALLAAKRVARAPA